MYRLGGCFWGYAGLKPSPTEKQPRLVINSNKDVRSEPWPLVDRVRGKLNCRPYREGGEGNPKRLVEAASLAFSSRSIFLTIRARDPAGSTIRSWNVDQDCVTEHDRRHAMLREYLAGGTPNNREVAKAIRPVLEAFLRVSCPEYFPPGTLLGQFNNVCS